MIIAFFTLLGFSRLTTVISWLSPNKSGIVVYQSTFFQAFMILFSLL